MRHSHDELARFCDQYLGRWETRANVRQRGRYTLGDSVTLDDVFPMPPDAAASFRGLDAVSPGLGHFVHAQMQYRFLNDGATVETDVVGPVVMQVAHRHAFALPESARQAALTVAVDEAYHALVAREFRLAAEQATGIAPVGLADTSAALEAMAAGRAEVPAELALAFELVAISLLENVITRELVALRPEQSFDGGALRVITEHLDDEGKHAAFFVRLLGAYWTAAPQPERVALAPGIARFCERFLDDAARTTRPWFRAVLDRHGVAGPIASKLEAGVAKAGAATSAKMWANLQAALRQGGLADDAAIRASFADRSSLVLA